MDGMDLMDTMDRMDGESNLGVEIPALRIQWGVAEVNRFGPGSSDGGFGMNH
jgi:hypothetical protein